MSKSVTALIVRMPLSGSVPLKTLLNIKNVLMARITWNPLQGNAPSKPFVQIAKSSTALIFRMP
eukprot:34219-Amphidinium_carterae.1